MARLARVIAVDVPHQVTQRGNARQVILDSDTDRQVYLDLLREYIVLHELSLVGYRLMSNHVHLVLVPYRGDALAGALKQTHGRYASYWNVRHASSGHVWQGRFYSCPLDLAHLWTALRYTELNPIRAGLVAGAADWPWSSAAVHLGRAEPQLPLDLQRWQRQRNAESWRAYLTASVEESETAAIRQCTHTGRPLGSKEFIQSLERAASRRLAPQKGGRPGKHVTSKDQGKLVFDH